MIEGSVDLLTAEKAIGWLSDRKSNEKFEVVATLSGRVIGEGPANLSRPDLKEVGYGDGMCGFDIAFYEKLPASDLASVIVSPRESTLMIPRSTMDSYIDFINSLTRNYPKAGRSRTVYGGLWTDRTDAMHVLAGRVKTGSCDRALLQEMRAFISDGVVQTEMESHQTIPPTALSILADASSNASDLKDAVLALAPCCLNAHVANLLKTIFDDVPVLYRPTLLTDAERPFGQASACERFSSPAEVAVCYFPGEGEGARLDYVLDSHELSEFGADGASRWTTLGAASLPIMTAGSQSPVRRLEIRRGLCLCVAPGLIHRVVAPAGATVVRALFSPKRTTPLRFLSDAAGWVDVDVGSGFSARL